MKIKKKTYQCDSKVRVGIVERGVGCTVRLRNPNGLHVSVHVPKGASKKLIADQAKVVKAAIFVMLPNGKDKEELRARFDVAVKKFMRRKRVSQT